MGRRKKEPIPNYDAMYKSTVTGLQLEFEALKKAIIKEVGLWSITSDGYIGVLDDGGKAREQRKKSVAEVKRLLKYVKELRDMKGDKEGR